MVRWHSVLSFLVYVNKEAVGSSRQIEKKIVFYLGTTALKKWDLII